MLSCSKHSGSTLAFRIVPEGHTIHRLAADLRKDFVGQVVSVDSPQGRFTDGASLINGEEMIKSEAWGKHLFCYWSSGNILHVHLGLIGKFRRASLETLPPETVRLRLTNKTKAWHLTGPQTCAIIFEQEMKEVVSKLGPDPLRIGVRGSSRFIRGLASRTKPIGAALLDQSLLAGIGNVYRSELLFLCGIHPETPCNRISEKQGEDLWNLIVTLLRKGKKQNRIVTLGDADSHDIPATRNKKEDSLYAYKRSGLDCRRCVNEIEVSSIGGRSIWYCPNCQEKQ